MRVDIHDTRHDHMRNNVYLFSRFEEKLHSIYLHDDVDTIQCHIHMFKREKNK